MQGNEPIASATIGTWHPDGDEAPQECLYALEAALLQTHRPLFLVRYQSNLAVVGSGRAILGGDSREGNKATVPHCPLVAWVPPVSPQTLGSASFREAFGLRYAYVMGAMAKGITSVEMVAAAGKSGMIGFFGAAGLTPEKIEPAIERLKTLLPEGPFGFNLIHSPHEPDMEAAVVDLYLRSGVRNISAAAYLRLTLPLLRYRLYGIHRVLKGRGGCRKAGSGARAG